LKMPTEPIRKQTARSLFAENFEETWWNQGKSYPTQRVRSPSEPAQTQTENFQDGKMNVETAKNQM
jgi:hypothetical protein